MLRRFLILGLCLLLLPALAACQKPKPPRPELLVFILAGQSNMSGRGDLRQLPAGFPADRKRIDNFSNAYEWVEAKEPLDDPKGQKDLCSLDLAPGVGPGVSFGQRLCELMPSVRVGLIPCALSGSDLRAWAPSAKPDTLYGSSLKRAAEAGKRGLVRGVLFFQGESDTYSRQAALAWPRRFAELVAAWRRDLKDPDLPVVFCQLGALGDAWRNDPRVRYWDLLKKEQAAIHIPHVVMVPTDDLALNPDGLHLSTSSQIFLGRRLAEAMHRLLTHQPPLPAD